MDERDWLAHRFEKHRAHLRAVAYRMLGSAGEADDAVQEAWLRLSRTETDEVENLGGWLTTVIARVCLDMLRSRASRREEVLDEVVEPTDGQDGANDPERDMMLADSVGLALLVVLDNLAPAERVAFVLHDLFDLPFDDIAPIVGRSPMATRQLASRARRRVRGASPGPDADRIRRRRIVDAFRLASRNGDLEALVSLLDPDVVLRADAATVKLGAEPLLRGAAVVSSFAGRARHARRAIVDGSAGLVWTVGGKPRVIFRFTIVGDKITEIDLVADHERLRNTDLVVLRD